MHARRLLPLLLLTLACGSSDPTSLQVKLNAGAAQWAKDKPSCRTYHYVRSVVAGESSVSSETSVEITDDHPTRRQYVQHDIQADGGVVQTEQWDETGAAVGSHTDTFKAATVEELLDICRNVVVQDPAKNTIYLEIGAHGVPTTCAFVPKGCQDDCDMGFDLSTFACGPLADGKQ